MSNSNPEVVKKRTSVYLDMGVDQFKNIMLMGNLKANPTDKERLTKEENLEIL